jgi:hypothetical protein
MFPTRTRQVTTKRIHTRGYQRYSSRPIETVNPGDAKHARRAYGRRVIPLKGDAVMRFLPHPVVPLSGTLRQERASQAWRAAADLVWARWDLVRAATPERRPAAFAAYVAALDAEDSAAEALADLEFDRAA